MKFGQEITSLCSSWPYSLGHLWLVTPVIQEEREVKRLTRELKSMNLSKKCRAVYSVVISITNLNCQFEQSCDHHHRQRVSSSSVCISYSEHLIIVWNVMPEKFSSWWLSCNYKSEPLVHCYSHYYHVVRRWVALRLMSERLCWLQGLGEPMPQGQFITTGGWELMISTTVCPLIDIFGKTSLHFPKFQPNGAPVACSSNLENVPGCWLFLLPCLTWPTPRLLLLVIISQISHLHPGSCWSSADKGSWPQTAAEARAAHPYTWQNPSPMLSFLNLRPNCQS